MNTKQLRQKILDLAIRGKLVPQDPNDEPASALLERIQKHADNTDATDKRRLKKSVKISSNQCHQCAKSSDKSPYQNLPFEVPENWAWCRLGDISEITSSKRIFQKEYIVDGIPFYRTK
jgi:type I restriction enzyme S subunit